jgi:hypothetical protein
VGEVHKTKCGEENTVIVAFHRCMMNIILPVFLYGCETWYLTLREEHTLRVFEKGVLRRMFGPKRDGVT